MKMPQGWGCLTGSPKRVTSRFKRKPSRLTRSLTAAIDMGPEKAGAGLCPACGKKMVPVIANGVDCLCCMDDRIVLPSKNS